MLRIGAALELNFVNNTMQFIDFLTSNGLNHIEIRIRSLDEIAAAYKTLDTGLLVENDYPKKDLIKFRTDQGDVQS